MSDDNALPVGWVWSTVGEIASVGTGTTPSRTQDRFWNDGRIPWITSSAVNQPFVSEAEQFVTDQALSNTTLKVYPQNTLIVALYGEGKTRGKVSELLIDATINQALAALGLHIPDQAHRRFVKYFLQGNYAALRRQAAGGMQPNLNLSLVNRIRVPVAPLNEQGRIVAKIEELFSNLDAGEAALKRAKANLKRYRAAVLKAAVEGKLTEEWRAKHPAKEPASALLARILKERRQKWEADQLAKFAASEKEPTKNWKDRYVEPTPPNVAGLPSIPNSWTWATLDAIADVVGGITKDQKKANQPGMRDVPYLRVANVQRGFFDLSEMKSIAASEGDIADLRLEPGDMLFTEGGDRDKLGRGWVWTGELSECIHQNHIFRGRLVSQDIQPRLISHHGNTFGKEWFIKAGKQTTNLASINLGILRRFPVPIPPAAEQAEIIAQVDETLSQIDAAEMQIEHGLLRASRLRQSILKQAFEGKLVPQDPKDEPANVLLEAIYASQIDNRAEKKVASNLKNTKRVRRQT